jgi:hypothetical protein
MIENRFASPGHHTRPVRRRKGVCATKQQDDFVTAMMKPKQNFK